MIITIKEFWDSFKPNDRFIFIYSERLINGIPKTEQRKVLRVESKNIITEREDKTKVWLQKPNKETIIIKNDDGFILKNYLCDGGDFIINIDKNGD